MERKNESKPPYPLSILPLSVYLDKIKDEGLYDEKTNLVIQRRYDLETTELTPEIFGSNLKGMSVNLLGGVFKPEFVKFTPRGSKNLPCEEKFNGEYDFDDKLKGIYIIINRIHDHTFPSPRRFPSEQEFKKVEEAIVKPVPDPSPKEKLLNAFVKTRLQFSSKEEYVVSYRIKVAHRPTNANYWHCQIEIAPDCEGGKTVDKDKSEWQRDALRAMTNFLVGYSSFSTPDPIPLVREEWYLKEPA